MTGPIDLLAALAALASSPAAAAAAPGLVDPALGAHASAPLNPRAADLFAADADLGAWAVRLYDRNHDGWLTLFEAQPALVSFKQIADSDRDGRVTTAEYARAKEFIAARW